MPATAFSTDLYQLTMMAGYIEALPMKLLELEAAEYEVRRGKALDSVT